MATADERKALGFLAAIALIGAGVRTVGVHRFEADTAATSPLAAPAPLAERALAAQIAAIDSARSAPPRKRAAKGRKSRALSSRPAVEPTPPYEEATSTPVDINAASAGELERLPRIGPALALRIVAWREEHGPFTKLEDLRHVRGIGPSTVRLLEPLVTFSGGHRPLLSEGSSPIAYRPRTAR